MYDATLPLAKLDKAGHALEENVSLFLFVWLTLMGLYKRQTNIQRFSNESFQ